MLVIYVCVYILHIYIYIYIDIVKGMTFVIHDGTILPVSLSPVSAAVCSVGHHGGWGGTHHLPRYGLPKDRSGTGL